MSCGELSESGIFDLQRHEQAIWSAQREDNLGCGLPVSDSVAGKLNVIRRNGRPFPIWLFDQMGSRLDHDFGQVRLHAGALVDELADEFDAAAFCVGRDIFLGRGSFCPDNPAVTLDAVCHELAHIAHAVEPARIRCWKTKGHEKLTVEACDQFNAEFDKLAQIESVRMYRTGMVSKLKEACSNLDFRGRFHPFHWWATLRYFLGGQLMLSYIPGMSVVAELASLVIPEFILPVAKGEGPRHGEGLNYTSADIAKNELLNRQKQDEEIKDAVDCFTWDKVPVAADSPPVEVLRLKDPGDDDWIKYLANALHTSQDRGAHREGRKGFGHGDRRVTPIPLSVGVDPLLDALKISGGWSPDDETLHDHHGHHHEAGTSWWICNAAAYNKAYNNSCEVLEQFFIALKLLTATRWTRRIHSCPMLGGLIPNNPLVTATAGQYRPGELAAVNRNPGGEDGFPNHGCVRGQCPAARRT